MAKKANKSQTENSNKGSKTQELVSLTEEQLKVADAAFKEVAAEVTSLHNDLPKAWQALQTLGEQYKTSFAAPLVADAATAYLGQVTIAISDSLDGRAEYNSTLTGIVRDSLVSQLPVSTEPGYLLHDVFGELAAAAWKSSGMLVPPGLTEDACVCWLRHVTLFGIFGYSQLDVELLRIDSRVDFNFVSLLESAEWSIDIVNKTTKTPELPQHVSVVARQLQQIFNAWQVPALPKPVGLTEETTTQILQSKGKDLWRKMEEAGLCDDFVARIRDSLVCALAAIFDFLTAPQEERNLLLQHVDSWLISSCVDSIAVAEVEAIRRVAPERLNEKALTLLEIFRSWCSSCEGWLCPSSLLVLVPRPSTRHVISMDGPERLHKDGQPAMAYENSQWKTWVLNGVLVPQELAETPAEKLDIKKWIAEANVELRREFVRKVGLAMVLQKLEAKVLNVDTRDPNNTYELLEFDVGLPQPVRALRMANPSLPGVFHVEFVPRTCQTAQEALNVRNHLTPDMIDDENGAEWIQQGDVIIRPLGAKKFKSRPSQLS